MGRRPCCSKEGLNRGTWTATEDKILASYIKGHGEGNWRTLPERAGLKRCGKSCRLRWMNYLRPDIKRGNISHDEEELIIRLHKLLGNRWSLISRRLPGRTDNEIKNYWNTTLVRKTKLLAQPSSFQPLQKPVSSGSKHPKRTTPYMSLPPPKTATRPLVTRAKPTSCTANLAPEEPFQNDGSPQFQAYPRCSVNYILTQGESQIPRANEHHKEIHQGAYSDTGLLIDTDKCDDTYDVRASEGCTMASGGSRSNDGDFMTAENSPAKGEAINFESWSKNDFSTNEETLDLDSFSFFINPEEWV